MGQPRESNAPPIRGVLGYLPGRSRPVHAILEARDEAPCGRPRRARSPRLRSDPRQQRIHHINNSRTDCRALAAGNPNTQPSTESGQVQLSVRSIEEARAFLEARDLIGSQIGNALVIDSDAVEGLAIRLVEGA
jgi:hypothetical protein